MTEQESVKVDWRGKIGGMDPDEVTEFLNLGLLTRLATLDADGYPYIVPVWHEWDPEEGVFWIIAREKSRWAKMMIDNPKVAMSIDEDKSPLRKVFVQGLVETVEEPNVGGAWVPIAERMSVRYLGEHGPDYLIPKLGNNRWLFKVTPVNFVTWSGVDWHDRYK